MFVFSLANGLPSGSRTVWSSLSLQPLAAGPLTPFSYSLLEEVAGRAWYQYFDDLNFAPMPRARVIRQIDGQPFLNLTLSAQRDSEMAAVAPISLLLDGKPFAIATHEKPGFLAAMKANRNRKKIEATLARYQQEMPTVLQKAEAWSNKTADLRWTQADILQVMEEIERISSASFKLFFAARHNLEWLYHRLFVLTAARQPHPANLALIGDVACDLTKLPEFTMAAQLLEVGRLCAENEKARQWLHAGDFATWETALPKPIQDAVRRFLADFGHRCANEGEIRNPRWQDTPQLYFSALHAYLQHKPKQPAPLPATQPQQRLLDAVDSKARSEAQQLIDQMRHLLQLQSDALDAFGHILTGTRRWALAAANEAMGDGRLQAQDDVFFFALEEMKQMMTGEWNISARQEIQDTCTKRRAEYERWTRQNPPVLLVGDAAATPTSSQGLPGVSGQATGPLRRWHHPTPHDCEGAIVGTEQLTSGWALILPFARALVAANGTPLDPLVAAARAWHVPTVVSLGSTFDQLVEGAQTTVFGEQGVVKQ